MGLFAITTGMVTKQGDTVWFPFETGEYESTPEDLLELMDDLNDGVLIAGYRLKLRREGELQVEVERDPIVIGKPMIGQIVIMNAAKVVRNPGLA